MTDRLLNHAKANRRTPTEPELRLWRHLSNRQLRNLKFRRQHPVANRILDFFCPALSLGIEVDGHTHDPVADRAADEYLYQHHDIMVLRFSNTDVMANMEGVLLTILDHARSLPQRWSQPGVLHPNPSSEEEGLEENSAPPRLRVNIPT